MHLLILFAEVIFLCVCGSNISIVCMWHRQKSLGYCMTVQTQTVVVSCYLVVLAWMIFSKTSHEIENMLCIHAWQTQTPVNTLCIHTWQTQAPVNTLCIHTWQIQAPVNTLCIHTWHTSPCKYTVHSHLTDTSPCKYTVHLHLTDTSPCKYTVHSHLTDSTTTTKSWLEDMFSIFLFLPRFNL